MLDEAHASYQLASTSPQANTLAPAEMKLAADALSKADEAWLRRDSAADVDHLAYLAKQRVAIAQEATRQRAAEGAVATASSTRDKIRLAARTDEADAAKQTAMVAKLDAAASQQQAAVSQQQATDAQSRNVQLLAQLKDLNARQTERGLVITIADVLFDTDKARLKPMGLRNIDKLVAVLQANPLRNAMVEGYTDSTGSQGHNLALSDRRAASVRTALLEAGISGSRVNTRGYGESFPVAGNDDANGRQLNRRVEIVISDDNGQIAPR